MIETFHEPISIHYQIVILCKFRICDIVIKIGIQSAKSLRIKEQNIYLDMCNFEICVIGMKIGI